MTKRLATLLTIVLAFGAVLVLIGRYGPYVGVIGAFMPDQPHARGHADLVIRVEDSPGMGTMQSFFSRPPDLVVTGDGTAYAHQWATSTGLVEPVLTFHLGEGGIQGLLKRASHDGLLADHLTYPMPDVQDGGLTRVVLATGNGRWSHSAIALEPGWGPTARGHLADFVSAARAVAASTSAVPFHATALRVMAAVSSEATSKTGDVGRWPARARVHLDAIGGCAVVTDPTVIRLLTTQKVGFYREGGTTYSLAAAVLLPGDSCSR